MRDSPVYADAVQRGVVGDDPLGLAPTNERLYNSAFPGFNNYVRHIRVYSAICWMTKQVTKSLETGKVRTNSEVRSLFEGAIEKIELALVWANQGAPGLAGNTRVFPDNDKPVTLRFDAFGTSKATLFDAPTYKPSLTSGLHFLEQRSGGTFGCLPYGEALADAFDEAVRDLPEYRWLRTPDKATARRSQVKALASALEVANPSSGEQDAFLASFFPEQLGVHSTNDERARWLTLQMMLRSVFAVCRANKAVGKSAAASPREIRACMARGIANDGADVTRSVERVQAWWAVLQVRQLQRLSLETLYCVVERWIAAREQDGESQALVDCIGELSMAGHQYLDDAIRENVGQLADFLRSFKRQRKSLYEAAAHWWPSDDGAENDADVFLYIDRLKERGTLEHDAEYGCEAIADAYIGLIFCAVEAINLKGNHEALKAMKADGDSCSLLHLADLLTKFQSGSVESFLTHVIKNWVILRHFAVVGSRSVPFDGKNRFRFVIGDYGLERFDKTAKLPLPGMSKDKLNYALLLCEQCGLLTVQDEGYRLTLQGKARLTG